MPIRWESPYTIRNVVQDVQEDTPASKAGIQAGDIVTSAKFVPPEDLKSKSNLPKKPFDLKKFENDWPLVQFTLQTSLPGTEVELSLLRNGKPEKVTMQSITSDEWNVDERGLHFDFESRILRKSNFVDAFWLGLSETKNGLMQVGFALKKIVSGKASTRNVGGPLTIVYTAGYFAEEGIPKLLTFLTMLSANLAVLNFLPIPVLDGGHAMFLIYEGIFRKPLNERLAIGMQLVGLTFIIGLMIFVLGIDIISLCGTMEFLVFRRKGSRVDARWPREIIWIELVSYERH